MWQRFQRQDCLAVHGVVEPSEQLFGMRQEDVDQLRLVGAAGALGNHRGHRLEPMGLGQRDGILRQRHQPDRQLHGIAGQAARQSLSIPPLVELTQIFADLIGETDPLGDPAGDLAVAGKNWNAHLHGLGKTLLDRLGQLRRRRIREGARDGTDNRLGQLRLVADVDALQVPAQRDLIAKRRRQQMGIGIASDVTQQRLVIDVAALMLVEARDLGQPHSQYAGSQRKIPRMAGCQVGRIGQRHQEVSASNHRRRHLAPSSATANLECTAHCGFAVAASCSICASPATAP